MVTYAMLSLEIKAQSADCIQLKISLTIKLVTEHNQQTETLKHTGKRPDAGAFEQFGRVAFIVFQFFEVTVDNVVCIPVKSSVAGHRRLLDRRHLCWSNFLTFIKHNKTLTLTILHHNLESCITFVHCISTSNYSSSLI